MLEKFYLEQQDIRTEGYPGVYTINGNNSYTEKTALAFINIVKTHRSLKG